MNLRQVWTELFQKPAGGCFSFCSLAESSCLCLAAAWSSAKAGQYDGRQAGYADEGIFLQRGHFAAISCAGHATGASVGQDGSRHTNTETSVGHSTDDLRY
jgi:hypothetical protein